MHIVRILLTMIFQIAELDPLHKKGEKKKVIYLSIEVSEAMDPKFQIKVAEKRAKRWQTSQMFLRVKDNGDVSINKNTIEGRRYAS